jgi:hypothetical protein
VEILSLTDRPASGYRDPKRRWVRSPTDGQGVTAGARAARREQRARDAALAWSDHDAAQLDVAARTARLRALRLAKEAGEAQGATAEAKRARRRKAPKAMA